MKNVPERRSCPRLPRCLHQLQPRGHHCLQLGQTPWFGGMRVAQRGHLQRLLWELQAAPSAASVGSVANTFTLCSGTWLMGGSTTEAASGVNSVLTHCIQGPTVPQESRASLSVLITAKKSPLGAPTCQNWPPDSQGLLLQTPGQSMPHGKFRKQMG